MSEEIIEVRSVPADEPTSDHEALAASAERAGLPPGVCEWVETTVLTEDVDGVPCAVTVVRAAAYTNCPTSNQGDDGE